LKQCTLGILIGLLMLGVFTACGSRQDGVAGDVRVPALTLKVAVFADGRLIVDGKSTSLDSLREKLIRLRAERGTVWYYREQGHEKPPVVALQVMKAVVEAGVPVRLSTRPDYSDGVALSPPH